MNATPQRTVLRIALFVVIVAGAASLLLFYYQSIRNFFKFHEIDFTSYVRASDWFFDGQNPYQQVARRYIYPLFLLLVIHPLTWLQSSPLLKGVSIALWSLGSFLAFFLTLGVAWQRLYQLPSIRRALIDNYGAIAIIVVMLHPYLQDEFLNGQVNLYVLGATAGFFYALQRDRLFLAALFIAVAASIKISPGLCLLILLFTRQWRTALYAAVLVPLFTVGLPLLVNADSLTYYRYFVTEVMPHITGSDFEGGFRSFSIISTFSYLLHLTWYPPLKILAVCLLAVGLFIPVWRLAPRSFSGATFHHRFAVFAAIITIIPLTFPMSEAHHLLLLTLPFLAIVAYWRQVIASATGFWRDRLSLFFLACVIGLQIGHGLKDTPIRLLCLIGMYGGMLMMLHQLRTASPDRQAEESSGIMASPTENTIPGSTSEG